MHVQLGIGGKDAKGGRGRLNQRQSGTLCLNTNKIQMRMQSGYDPTVLPMPIFRI